MNTPVPEVYEYDPSTDSWTTKASMPTPRSMLGAVAVDGKIVTFAGEGPGAATKIIEEYDPISDIWTPVSDMPTIRNEAFAAAIDDKIYVFGGYDQWTMESVNFVSESGNTLLLMLAGACATLGVRRCTLFSGLILRKFFPSPNRPPPLWAIKLRAYQNPGRLPQWTTAELGALKPARQKRATLLHGGEPVDIGSCLCLSAAGIFAAGCADTTMRAATRPNCGQNAPQ